MTELPEVAVVPPLGVVALIVPPEQGQITIPAVSDDPLAIGA